MNLEIATINSAAVLEHYWRGLIVNFVLKYPNVLLCFAKGTANNSALGLSIVNHNVASVHCVHYCIVKVRIVQNAICQSLASISNPRVLSQVVYDIFFTGTALFAASVFPCGRQKIRYGTSKFCSIVTIAFLGVFEGIFKPSDFFFGLLQFRRLLFPHHWWDRNQAEKCDHRENPKPCDGHELLAIVFEPVNHGNCDNWDTYKRKYLFVDRQQPIPKTAKKKLPIIHGQFVAAAERKVKCGGSG